MVGELLPGHRIEVDGGHVVGARPVGHRRRHRHPAAVDVAVVRAGVRQDEHGTIGRSGRVERSPSGPSPGIRRSRAAVAPGPPQLRRPWLQPASRPGPAGAAGWGAGSGSARAAPSAAATAGCPSRNTPARRRPRHAATRPRSGDHCDLPPPDIATGPADPAEQLDPASPDVVRRCWARSPIVGRQNRPAGRSRPASRINTTIVLSFPDAPITRRPRCSHVQPPPRRDRRPIPVGAGQLHPTGIGQATERRPVRHRQTQQRCRQRRDAPAMGDEDHRRLRSVATNSGSSTRRSSTTG